MHQDSFFLSKYRINAFVNVFNFVTSYTLIVSIPKLLRDVELTGSDSSPNISTLTAPFFLNLYMRAGNATRLLIMQRNSLGLLNVKSQQFVAIHSPVLDPVALTFDVARGWYYWADSHGSIYKSDGQHSWTIYTG